MVALQSSRAGKEAGNQKKKSELHEEMGMDCNF